ncbi:MAG: hypothetical protein EOO06_15530 [Chitinophagaceae bacterium]|nr:MAG: hypothetical protein EOO06_15530 [Chitinophagaceae bacterium]
MRPSYKLSLQRITPLSSVSSGSGVVLLESKSRLFIISDNVNGFFSMDTAAGDLQFYPFKPQDTALIQSKNIKEDFESACMLNIGGVPQLMAFGSGSIDSSRQRILFFPLKKPEAQTTTRLPEFYNSLKTKMNISTRELNIEAAFSTKDSLYLLNRGTNQAIGISISDFEKTIQTGSLPAPAVSLRTYSLPLLDSFPVAFSGACHYRDNRFLFCASVEKTTDWVADGEVAGSYIGMADLNGDLVFLLPLVDSSGKMLPQKLESIDVVRTHPDGSISIIAISDNDNGQSTWFNILLQVSHSN